MAPAQLDVERVPRAVVRVEPTARIGNDLTILAFGSGSIIDASGLILTNSTSSIRRSVTTC